MKMVYTFSSAKDRMDHLQLMIAASPGHQRGFVYLTVSLSEWQGIQEALSRIPAVSETSGQEHLPVWLPAFSGAVISFYLILRRV